MLGEHPHRAPPQFERNVQRVHAEIPQHADGAAILSASFPVERFLWVQIARVQETRAHYDDSTQAACAAKLVRGNHGREKRKLRAATDETPGGSSNLADVARGTQIDAERFFS